MRGLGIDHVISVLMRGLEINITGRGYSQIVGDGHCKYKTESTIGPIQ